MKNNIPPYLLHPYFKWWTDNEKEISYCLGCFVVGLLLGLAIGLIIFK